MRTVYLDNAATTKIDSRVVETMLPWLENDFGNANSTHRLGRHAHVAVEDARERIASILGCKPAEIIFTSGGTESNNAAIKGLLTTNGQSAHIITSSAEHHAVLEPVRHAVRYGHSITELNAEPNGVISADLVGANLRDNTILVSLMHANNEIASINPIRNIAETCRKHNIALHTDAVQSLGKIPVQVDELGVDMLSASAHKFHGPKGVGFLYVRNGTKWKPWLEGGSQERGRRGGTLNVPGIIGMSKALEIATEEMESNRTKIAALRDQLANGLQHQFPEYIRINGDSKNGIHNILNCSFASPTGAAIDGEMLLLNLDIEGICCSSGSACTSGAIEASHVLRSLGIPEHIAKSSVRFSLSKYTTEDEIQYTLDKLKSIIPRLLKTTAA